MITALNKLFDHGGRQFQLQAEDCGVEQAAFEVRVYERGAVLWKKRVGYAELLQRGLPRIEQDEAILSLMDKTLVTVEAAIAKGKLG